MIKTSDMDQWLQVLFDNGDNIIAKEIEVVDIDNDILYKTTTKRTIKASTQANILGKCVSLILEHQKIQRQFFLSLHKNICCDPSLEPSRRDGSNEGSQNMFL